MGSNRSLFRFLVLCIALALGTSAATATVLRRHAFAPGGLHHGRTWCTVGEPAIQDAINASHTLCLYLGFLMPNGGPMSAVETYDGLPAAFAFAPVHPNPVRSGSTLRYSVPRAAHVTIRLYSVAGGEVETLVDADREPGFHTVQWNADRLPAGVYFCRMTAPGFASTRKVLLLR